MEQKTMTYTVIGVWLNDKPVTVGVIEGRHNVDGGDQETFTQGVWATSVDAVDVEQAEAFAKGDMTENDS
jgi:hypothetical protein